MSAVDSDHVTETVQGTMTHLAPRNAYLRPMPNERGEAGRGIGVPTEPLLRSRGTRALSSTALLTPPPITCPGEVATFSTYSVRLSRSNVIEIGPLNAP